MPDFKAVSKLTPSAASPRFHEAPVARAPAGAPAAADKLFIDRGTINFTLHNTTENAEFVLVLPTTQLHDVAAHMIDAWGLEKPGIILRVTGRIDERELDDMTDVLEGVVHSASEANGFSAQRPRIEKHCLSFDLHAASPLLLLHHCCCCHHSKRHSS